MVDVFKGSKSQSNSQSKETQKKMLNEKKEKLEELFCYVFFSQQKDKTNPRGYKQSSLVLVSRLKLIKIFHVDFLEPPNVRSFAVKYLQFTQKKTVIRTSSKKSLKQLIPKTRWLRTCSKTRGTSKSKSIKNL
jgi:hypothetical protein